MAENVDLSLLSPSEEAVDQSLSGNVGGLNVDQTAGQQGVQNVQQTTGAQTVSADNIPSLAQLTNAPTTTTSGPGDGLSTPKDPASVPSITDMANIAGNQAQLFDRYKMKDWLYHPYKVSQSDLRKYDDPNMQWHPNVDMEDWYAQSEMNQGFFKNTGRAIGRFTIGAVAKTGEGIGFVGSLAYNAIGDAMQLKWDGSQIIADAADNGFSKVFSNMEDKLKNDWIPVYQEASDRGKGFWYRAFHDAEFWTDEVVDGAAFMASAWLPGIGLSKLGLGMKVAQGLSRFRTGITAAEAAVEEAGAAANYLSKANTLFKTGVDKFNAWGLATGSEAMFEAAGVKDKIYHDLTYDAFGGIRINPDTGRPYTEDEKRQIAGANARNTFLWNAALLAGTNAIELSWLSKPLGFAEKGTVKGITGGAKLGEDIAIRATPTNFFGKIASGRIGAFMKGAAEGVITEGYLEENGQLAIQRINETYGAKGKISNIWNLKELFKQYAGQTIAATQGEDPEAAANIGIGGLLGLMGGKSALGKYKANQAITNMAVNAYNNANQPFLKFGNVYKIQEVDGKDGQGNPIKLERLAFDKSGHPELDDEKMVGIVGNYASVNAALDEANKVNDKFKRDLLRDSAFADLVSAHIGAGLEGTISDKLDAVRNMTSVDAAKLGFVLTDNIDGQIAKYKKLAADIIAQNKLMNQDILVKDEIGKKPSEDAKLDTARKTYMTSIAARQAVYRNLANDLLTDAENIRSKMTESTATSLSDGIVDQLNDLEYRIKSQEEFIENIKEQGGKAQSILIATQVLNELKKDKETLKKENEDSIKDLKVDEQGYYQYEKPTRNLPGVDEAYIAKVKLHGDLKNQIKFLGLQWAKFADTKNGRENFKKYLTDELVGPVLDKQLKDEEKAASKEQKPKKEQPSGLETLLTKGKKGETKVIGEEEVEAEETPEATITYTNEAGEEESFDVKEGASYKSGDDIYKIIKIDFDNDLITYQLNDEAPAEAESEDFAKIANENNFELIKGKAKVKKTKATKTSSSRKKRAVTETPDEMLSDIDIESNPETPTFSGEDKLPKFEEVGFNKTFGVHYINKPGLPKDKIINTESGADRFFRFTSKFDTKDKGYVLKVVTENNDNFDIREPKYNTDDIKVIVMKKTVKGGKTTYNYVDENNEIIPDNEAKKENILYMSLADIKKATPETLKSKYTIDESTNTEAIEKQIEAHAKWQKGLLARTKKGDVYLDVVQNSPGKQYVEYTNAIGKNGKREIAKASVEGRVVVEDPDWSDLKSANNPEMSIALRVSTRKGVIAPGIEAGRVVLQEYSYPPGSQKREWGKVTRVFNRELNDNEKKTIIQALARFSELFGRTNDKKNPLTAAESAEYTIIFEYLRGVVNWSAPLEDRDPSRYMWIQNGLHVGDRVYKFNRATIEANGEEILDGMYHHVNNKLLWNNKEFQTIKFVKNKAEIKDSYDTYEEYLLTSKEKGEVPPVYTSLPLIDSEYPQRTNSYLIWRDPSQTEAAPIGKIKRTYTTSYQEKKAEKKEKGARPVYTKVDKVINDFINNRKSKISIYKTKISRLKEDGNYYVSFEKPDGKVFVTPPYASLAELLKDKYKIRQLIYNNSGYNPTTAEKINKTTKAARASDKGLSSLKNFIKSKGAKAVKGPKTKGFVKVANIEEGIMDGSVVAMTRNSRYHETFYKGDGLYKTESGELINIVHRGLIKYKSKTGFIWGKDIRMSKNEFAQDHGFEDWDSFKEAADFSDAKLIEGKEAVEYYTVSPYDESQVLENPLEEEETDTEEEEIVEKPKTKKESTLKNLKDLINKVSKSKTGTTIVTSKKTAPKKTAPSEEAVKAVKERIALAKQKREQAEAARKTPAPKKTKTEAGEIVKSYNIDDAVENAQKVGNKLRGYVYQVNTKTGEEKLQLSAEVDIPGGNTIIAKNLLRKALSKQLTDDASEELPPFRMSLDEVEKTEDFKALKNFMEYNLPQFPIKIMSHLIYGNNWGMFNRGAIYIYEKAGYGTGFHEAFEGVWASYLTDAEQQELATEFRNREGSFYNPFTKQTKAYSDASMYDVREMLAEEFIKHVTDNNADKKLGNKILNFFKNLWNHIKALFDMKAEDKKELNSRINTVFNSITTGKFKNATPIRELNLVDKEFKAAGDLTQKETAGILEGINFFFFRELYSKGNNIGSILNNLSKKETGELLAGTFQSSFNQAMDRLSMFPNLKTKAETYRVAIYDIFKENLQRYGLSFDDLEIAEDKINDPLGIRSSITIDPRKMTSASVRLLLASLPRIQYKNGNPSVVVSEGFNQPRLVDADRVHVILLNELSNIVPVVDDNTVRRNVLDQMFEKLDEKYLNEDGTYIKDYGWIEALKTRLKYTDENGNKVDPSTLTADEMKMRVAFTKSFNNIRTAPEKVIVGMDGQIYNFNPLTNVNLDRVKQNWSNNLKDQVQNKEVNIVKFDSKGKLIIDRSTPAYADLVSLLDFPNAIDLDASLFILDHFGIEFSASDERLAESTSTIRENAIQILSLVNEQKINTVEEIYGNDYVKGRIDALLNVEARFTSEDNILSYMTPSGEQQYSVTLPSLLSNVINGLNTVRNHTELINTFPHLGYFDEKGNPQLNPYQKSSALLQKGGILFDNKGKRKNINQTSLTYHVITGMGVTESEGTSTDDLQFPERVANKIHYLLKNIGFSNINSDKSTEFGIGIPGKMLITRQDVSNYMSREGKAGRSYRVVLDRYIADLEAEMAAAVEQKNNPQFIQYYQDGVYKLGHFRHIMSEKLLKKFATEVLGATPKYEGEDAHVEFMVDNARAIEGDINGYLTNIISETNNFLKDLDIFQKASKTGDKYITNAISNSLLDEVLGKDKPVKKKNTENTLYSEADIDLLSGILAFNEEVLLAEQHKVIYGHPAMYKDLAKRVSGATATKESFVEDDDVIEWMDNNMERNDGKVRSEDLHQITKVVSFKDQNVISLFYKDVAEGLYDDMLASGVSKQDAEKQVGATFNDNKELVGYIYDSKGKHTGAIANYMSLNEADAMAWGMPDAIRDMLFTTSKLTPEQEAQWDYEIAYEKIARSKRDKKDPAYVKYTKEELKQAQDIIDKGDPGYIFQVLKPQYFGYADTVGVTHPVFLKHAVQPKFFRHVEGTQYENLYIAAQNNQVDIIGFESGEKVGNVTDASGEFTSIYDDQGRVNIQAVKGVYTFPKTLPIQNIFSKYYGIQVETSNKAKNSVVRGTQVTKLIMVNFYNNGAPISEEAGKLIEEYNDTLNRMIRLGKEELLKTIGLKREKNGSYTTDNLFNLVQTLRNEAVKRDMPDNIINAINAVKNPNGTQELQYSFDTLSNRDKIDNILNAIVDSTVISAKMFGKSSPQVSSTLYESSPRNFMYLKDGVYVKLDKKNINTLTEEQKKSIKMTSSDLKFYYTKDGRVSKMDVYMTWPFKEVTPEEMGLKLENGVYKVPEGGMSTFSKELLTAISFRIPTSGMNLIEHINIKGFTPIANGDMIVVPSEIVGKSGSDFDIDKLSIYLNRYTVEGVDYTSKEFKAFMIKDFVENGRLSRADAKKLFESYTVEDYSQINKATYTETGKEEKGALFSLEDLGGYDKLKGIKQSLQRYNAQWKGKKSLKYVQPNTTTNAGLQNKLISVMSDLMSLPENYAQLVTPNTTTNLENLAETIRKAKIKAGTIAEEDEKSPTFLRTFIGSSQIRERYLTAKRMVGIAAVHLTFHALAQVSGLKVNSQFKTKDIHYLMPKSKTGKYAPLKSINIKLSHHERDADGYYNIGNRLDVANQMISSLFNEQAQGFVDGAKNPFVFDLNFSMNSANTWFYLQHQGVPTEEIAYFYAQPIMDSYFKEFAKNRSNFKIVNDDRLYKDELFYKVITPFYDRVFKTNLAEKIAYAKASKNPFNYINLKKDIAKNINKINSEFEKFNLKDLKAAVSKGSKADAKLQLAVLTNFLEYEAQGRLMSGFMQGISYDTKKTKTIQENQVQVARWKRAVADNFIANPGNILDSTFLGEMKEQKEDISNMFENFFVSLNPEVQKVFEPLYDKINDPDYFATQDSMIDMINRYQNFVISYVLHTTPYINNAGKQETLNGLYRKMLLGRDNLAKQLIKFKNSSDPEVADNLIIRELLPILSDNKNKTNNISLFRNRMDSFQINNVIEAVDNLRSYAQDIADDKLLDFVDNLGKFVILQSGMQTSGIDFRKALSIGVYSDFVKDVLDRFKNDPNLNATDVWRNFHQNNWKRKDTVPMAPSWIKIKDGVIVIKEDSSYSKNDYLLKYYKIPNTNPIQFNSILFEKTNERNYKAAPDGTETVEIVYQAINKLGDGRLFTEIYPEVNSDSIIEENNITFRQPTRSRNILKTEDVSSDLQSLYQGGYSDKGKGTPQGDAKDKEMRRIADAAIVELANDKPSSSKTTIDKLGAPDYTKDLYKEGLVEVVMLARNAQLKNRPLRPETLDQLDEAIENGVHFIVGDMPGVDTPFIEYLLKKQATFQIYGSDENFGGRIATEMPGLWKKILAEAMLLQTESEEEDMPDDDISNSLPSEDEESECKSK